MSVCVISANLGSFDQPVSHVRQSVPYDLHLFTDENFPPRHGSMTSRLQARIVMMFGWEMIEKAYDYYIWIDASMILSRPDSIQWWVDQCKDVDIALFHHPQRKTVQEEADYVRHRLAIGCPYITPRYENELIDEQMKQVKPNDPLYIGTVFCYKNTAKFRAAMKEWFFHTARYHLLAQMALAHSLRAGGCAINVIEQNYQKCDYVSYVRPRGHK